MASDDGADFMEFNLAAKVRKSLFDQSDYGVSIIDAVGVADVARSGIVGTAFRNLQHSGYESCHNLLFGADLFAGDQMSFHIDIQKGTNPKRIADQTGRLGYSSAANEIFQCRREEPALCVQLARFHAVCGIIKGKSSASSRTARRPTSAART